MKKLLFLFVSILVWVPIIVRAETQHVVINQVQVAGSTATDEFIEFYNPTNSPIVINGWSVQYRNSNGNFGKKNLPNATIPPMGFFLFAGAGYTGSVAADVAQSTISLASTSGTIFLVNNATLLTTGTETTIVDSLSYGTDIVVPPAGQALLRIDSGFEVGTSNPHNLALSPDSQTTEQPPQNSQEEQTPPPLPPPPPSTPSYSSDIVISEFLPNPGGTDSGHEWVELYNSSDTNVDLSGWFLDDESTDGSLGTSAYTLPAGSIIDAKGYFVADLSEGSFALDNTGGDALRLFWPDKNLASQVSYTDAADENSTFALNDDDGGYAWTIQPTKGSTNQIVAKPVAGSGGTNLNTTQNQETQQTSYVNDKLQIDKIFPNPSGTDSGSEWVEVVNVGQTTVTMHEWILDDGDKDDSIGSSAYHIQSPTLKPGDVATITIPAGRFAMNNTGSDTVRLFSPDKVLVDFVTYQDAKDGVVFAKVNGTWAWQTVPEDTDAQVVINEIFPYPSRGEEFIELLNISDKAIDLTGWKLKDQNGSYSLPNQTLEAGKFLVIKRSASNIALANSAKENLQLISDKGFMVSALEYEDAPKNSSLARTDAGDYDWSILVTPGEVNKFSKKGSVAGATLVRTGNPDPKNNSMILYFAVFAIIWYIAGRLLNVGETNDE